MIVKSKHRDEVKVFQNIPNVGPAMERDFRLLGYKTPQELIGNNPETMYQRLENITGKHQDTRVCCIRIVLFVILCLEKRQNHGISIFQSKRRQLYTSSTFHLLC
jgi:hypothetical protein